MQGLSRLRNMFRVPDLRNKILFTIFIIAIFRLGSHIPVPYVDFRAIKELKNVEQRSGVVGFLDLFSGGALTNVAVFFLGIMPYITASIIMQLLGVVIPKLEQWQQEGQTGQKKITQWTRYLTVALALMQSTALRVRAEERQRRPARLGLNAADRASCSSPTSPRGRPRSSSSPGPPVPRSVMWLGELITQRGIGNGMSILIFASVVSRLPFQGAQPARAVGQRSSSRSSSSSPSA